MSEPILTYVPSATDLSYVKYQRFCTFDVLHDRKGDALLRVSLNNHVMFALKFEKISPPELTAIRSNWGQLYRSEYARNTGSMFSARPVKVDWHNVVPVVKVDTLPTLEMWPAQTSWGENAFWANPEMRLCVTPGKNEGCFIEILNAGDNLVGAIRFATNDPDDDYVLEQAQVLRSVLHLSKQTRVEMGYGTNRKSCFYLPKA